MIERIDFCDLHIHSTASDGSDTPEELIAVAQAEGLSAVALCDHNTVAGLERFEAAAEGTGVMAVPGVEVSAGYRGHEVHILGLFIEKEVRTALSTYLGEIRRRKTEANLALIDRLAAAGYQIDHESVAALAGEAYPNRVHIANVLMAGGYVRSVQEAFQTLLRDGGNFYRAPERLDAFEVIESLRSLNILPISAHPSLTLTPGKLRRFLSEGAAHGLCGVETIYPLYSEEDASHIRRAAVDFGLLPSGGSDYHGKNKPDIRMGRGRENIEVPLTMLDALRSLHTALRSHTIP